MEQWPDRELEELFGGPFPLTGGDSDSAAIMPSASVNSGPSEPGNGGPLIPLHHPVSTPTDSGPLITVDDPVFSTPTNNRPLGQPADRATAGEVDPRATIDPETEAQQDEEKEIDQLNPATPAADLWLAAYKYVMKRLSSGNHNIRSHDELLKREHLMRVTGAINLDHVLFKQLRETIGPKILESFEEFRRQGFCIKADLDWIGAELTGARDLAEDITNCKAYEQLMRVMCCVSLHHNVQGIFEIDSDGVD